MTGTGAFLISLLFLFGVMWTTVTSAAAGRESDNDGLISILTPSERVSGLRKLLISLPIYC